VVLGIGTVAETAMEEAMDDGSKKTAKAEASTKEAPAKKKTAKQVQVKKETKAKEAKPKRAKVENPVVFAFRLSEADRGAIHKAAGPAGATRFVRCAALAAATGNREEFDVLVTQARANQK